MQVGIDNEEPGREAKNETTKKIIFIKIPNVQNDNEDINMNSNVNSNVHMQSQSQLQRSINKPKKSIIPYEKPPAVFLPTEKLSSLMIIAIQTTYQHHITAYINRNHQATTKMKSSHHQLITTNTNNNNTPTSNTFYP